MDTKSPFSVTVTPPPISGLGIAAILGILAFLLVLGCLGCVGVFLCMKKCCGKNESRGGMILSTPQQPAPVATPAYQPQPGLVPANPVYHPASPLPPPGSPYMPVQSFQTEAQPYQPAAYPATQEFHPPQEQFYQPPPPLSQPSDSSTENKPSEPPSSTDQGGYLDTKLDTAKYSIM